MTQYNIFLRNSINGTSCLLKQDGPIESLPNEYSNGETITDIIILDNGDHIAVVPIEEKKSK